jgi:hypothetical protein
VVSVPVEARELVLPVVPQARLAAAIAEFLTLPTDYRLALVGVEAVLVGWTSCPIAPERKPFHRFAPNRHRALVVAAAVAAVVLPTLLAPAPELAPEVVLLAVLEAKPPVALAPIQPPAPSQPLVLPFSCVLESEYPNDSDRRLMPGKPFDFFEPMAPAVPNLQESVVAAPTRHVPEFRPGSRLRV